MPRTTPKQHAHIEGMRYKLCNVSVTWWDAFQRHYLEDEPTDERWTHDNDHSHTPTSRGDETDPPSTPPSSRDLRHARRTQPETTVEAVLHTGARPRPRHADDGQHHHRPTHHERRH